MELFIVLLKICGILSFAYLCAVYGYKFLHKTTIADAQTAISDIIKEEVAALINGQTQMPEPVPTDVVIDAILDICDVCNKLKKNFTKWNFDKNSNGFPVIAVNIVADDDCDFKTLIAALETYIMNCLEVITPTPLVYVFSEKCGDNRFRFHICYACHASAQDALRTFVCNKANLHEKQVLKRETPVINDALEKEIADMKKGETYGQL